jgi:hypothetical protein
MDVVRLSRAARSLAAVLVILLGIAGVGCGSGSNANDAKLRSEIGSLCRSAAARERALRITHQRTRSHSLRQTARLVDRSGAIVRELAIKILRRVPPPSGRQFRAYGGVLLSEAASLHDLATAIAHHRTKQLPRLSHRVAAFGQIARRQAASAGLAGCGQAPK